MSFAIGLSAAVLGNIVIGAGQCLQKYALYKIEREYEARLTAPQPYHARTIASGGYSLQTMGGSSDGERVHGTVTRRPNAHAADTGSDIAAIIEDSGLRSPYSAVTPPSITLAVEGPRPRYKSPLWLLGIGMNYTGEAFGNSMALSYLSAAVVAPLSIIAVLVNLLLAASFLGEHITPKQRYGCLWVVAGVLTILAAAPRSSAPTDRAAFVQLVESSGVVSVFAVLYAALGVLILTVRRGHQSLLAYVAVASIFGTMNVMVSKLLTTYMRLSIEGPLPHPFDVAVHGLPHGERHDPRTFQIQQWPYGQQQQPPRLATTLSFTQLCVFALMAGSVIGQEIFRQRALGQYPVMVFQPIFFAAYNTIATLVGLVLFKEIAGAGAIATFFSVFAVGLGLIVYGSRFLKSPGSAADGPGLPTAYPRRSTTFHSALSFSKWRKKDL